MIILLILLLSLVLRIISIDQSLWLDEAINVVYAKSNSFWWLVTEYPLGDFHPPGYFAIIWVWGHVFNFSEVSVRTPSVLFGVVTVFLTYLIGKNLFSKKVGLIASLFLAIAPLHIYYSQEARMYSFTAFSVALATFFLILMIQNKRFAFWGYTLALILVFYSDYLAYFLLPAHLGFIYIFYRNSLRKFFRSCFILFCVLAPWLLVFPKQITNGQQTANIIEGWKNVVGGANVEEPLLLIIKTLIGRISFDDKLMYGLIIGVVVIPYLIFFIRGVTRSSNLAKILLFWIAIPLVVGFLVSFYLPVFSYFRFLFILPAFYLLLAQGVEGLNVSFKNLLVVVIILSELASSGLYLVNVKFHREDWQSAVRFIERDSDIHSAVIFENSEILAPFSYYNQNLIDVTPAFYKIPAQSNDDLKDLENLIGKKRTVYVLDYLVDITDPKRLLTKKIQSLGYRELMVVDFRGVGLIRKYQRF